MGAVLALLVVASPALADDPATKAKAEARVRYDRAVQLSDEGDFERALAEFQKAYEILPNARVLLNMAQIQSALNHPADAITSIDLLLANPGNLSPDDVTQARALKTKEETKVAEITVKCNVDGAQLEVDNVAQGTLPRKEPLRIGSGQHIVAAYAPGHAPLRKLITVASGAKDTVDFQLLTIEARLAHLLVRAAIPGAKLVANGQEVGQTPFATTLTFVPGNYKLELSRPGYGAATRELALGDGATGEVSFDLPVDPGALAEHSGALHVKPSEPGTSVTIDGVRGAYDAKLPPGPHALAVEKAGFLKYERTIQIKEAGSTDLTPYMVPTIETRADYEKHAATSRTVSYALLGTGGALVVAGGVLAVVFTGQRSDKQQAYDDAKAAGFVNGKASCDDVCLAKFDAASTDLDSAKTKQTIAFVGLGVGVVAAGAGAYWLLTSDDPHKYENAPKAAGLRFSPTGGVLPGGGFGGLTGTF